MKSKVRDAICGEDLSRERYVFSLHYKGETYSFCSVQCRRAFENDPGKYSRGALARTLTGLRRFFTSQDRETDGKCC